MKINKEIRQTSRQLLRASFTDGQLDRGKIGSLVQSLIDKKPRHLNDVLENYKRLIRLEAEKRHARVESANELNSGTRAARRHARPHRQRCLGRERAQPAGASPAATLNNQNHEQHT
jgi:hypothetical protein